MKKSGTEYELFVQKIQQAIIDSEPYAKQKNIIVEHNKKLIDRCGIQRQFDLYWEYELGGLVYKNIIECKDYENGVSIEKLDALIGKMHDFPGIRPIIATRVKFQSGAIEKAKDNNIDIIIVRDEDIEKDWKTANGTPIIRTIRFDIHILMPVIVTRFQPVIDREWAMANNITTLRINAPSNEVFINNIAKNSRISLYEFENQLPRNEGDKEFKRTIRETFENAFLEAPDVYVKIKAIEIDFIAPPQQTESVEVSPEVAGVVEYINNSRKKMIINNCGAQEVKDWQA